MIQRLRDYNFYDDDLIYELRKIFKKFDCKWLQVNCLILHLQSNKAKLLSTCWNCEKLPLHLKVGPDDLSSLDCINLLANTMMILRQKIL